ncbi:KH domain-containing protein [Ditylenchus destructor]|uniref:KH domain-containing protein n=1 Tax=Ditylenchus destructor TaxID=166010 RepID=A0AAD4N053_9BILA|nr:KH domain-containing protein [Ditylenchus destructor]
MAGNPEYGGYSAENYGYGQMPPPEYGGGYGMPGGGRPGMPPGGMPYGYGYPPAGGPGAGYPDPSFMPSPLDAEIQVVCREIHTELHTLEQSGEYGEQFKNARRLLTTEVSKLENNIDPEWLEVDINKPIKVTKKILIPSFRHPKFNFVGKVLGPKGQTLQNIAKQFKCHVYILGRGSTRDRAKEQELLQSGDPQFAHYGGPLHVKVETTAPPAVAYGRVAGVLEVLSQLLVKDTVIDGITTAPEDKPEGENGEGNGDADDQEGGDNGEKGGGGFSSGGFQRDISRIDLEQEEHLKSF